MNIRFFSLALFSILALLATADDCSLFGQERGRFDAESYLKRLDVNDNERIEPSEISGRMEDYLKRLGFNTKESIRLKDISRKIDEDRRKDDDRRNDSRSSDKTTSLKVPGFGADDQPVPGFGTSAVGSLDEAFSTTVIEQVNETLRKYDRDRNGTLEAKEIGYARWGSPSPAESDTNGDGKLSRVELSNRYRAREMYQRDNNQGENRDRDDNRGSDRDRGSSDRRDFRSSSNYRPAAGGSTTPSSNSTASSSSSKDRYASYLIGNYDKDKDGKLSVEEIKNMKRPPKNADADQDGFVTKEELADSLSGSSSSKSEGAATSKTQSRAPTTFRRSSGASKSDSRSSSTLSGLDTNQNNQVEMHEFSSEWDEKKLAEFYEKDQNGDGVITLREWSGK